MKSSKIALLSLGGIVVAAIVVTAVAGRIALSRGGVARVQIGPDPGEMTTVSHDLRGFNAIEIMGAWTVTVTQGDDWRVDLSSDENFVSAAEVSVRGERLSLNGAQTGSFFGRSDAQFLAEVVMPELEELDAAGGMRVTLSGFEGERLSIDVAGATELTGADGRYAELDLSMAGASNVQLAGFVFTDANVELAGASNLELTMDGGELTGTLAGAGRIQYFGTVSREAVDVAGFGSIGPAEL